MDEYQSAGRLPPHNPDAEWSVLGACLIDRDALSLVLETLQEEYFYDPRNAIAFGVMKEMHDRDRAVDHLTFEEELSRRGLMDRVGGGSYIAMIMDAVPTTANVEHHCSIVRDKYIHRSLIKAGGEVTKLGFNEELESDEALVNAERIVFDVARKGTTSTIQDIKEVVYKTFEKIEASINQGPTANGVPSGFADLDNLTNGFQPGSLNIIAARPSVGKTAFALNIAQYAAVHERIPALLFSMEMPAEDLAERMLSSLSELNIREIKKNPKPNSDIWNKLTSNVTWLSKSPIYIDDSSTLNTLELRSRCRRFFSKYKPEKGIIIVDYLQMMASTRKTDSKQLEVSDISRALKAIAREFSVPVVALSQLSREVEKRKDEKRPVLSDLRDSGSIEQDADLVAFLYRAGYYDQPGSSTIEQPVELNVAKHRNGPLGTIKLVFHMDISKFAGISYLRPPGY